MFLSIDIGGTNTRVGLFPDLKDRSCSILARFPTPSRYEQLITQLEQIKAQNPNRLQSVGVSVAGRIAPDGRTIMLGTNIQDYVHRNLAQDLESIFGCPARLAHDPVCGLLGEKRLGVLAGAERCAYMTLSTGTAAAYHLHKAGHEFTVSIEFGHQILDGNALKCACGQIGCLETFTGGKQLEARLGHSLASMHDRAFWETFTDKLALGVINFAQLTRIEAIAISGAIVQHNSFIIADTQQKIELGLTGASLRLFMAQLGEDAPLVGAAGLIQVPEEQILH